MDLRTTYMGIPLKNPLVVSACPLSEKLGNVKRMEDAGASAVVMFSLFEEQIKHDAASLDYFTELGTENYAESLSFFPEATEYRVGPETYLELLSETCGSVDIPVIASLNGITNEGWIEYALEMEKAGASAIELNVYYLPVDGLLSGNEVEARYLEVLRTVKSTVSVPVAIKLGPFFSSFAHFATQLDEAGADGLVLFNRFFQPDIDLKEREVVPDLQLSTPMELRLPLLWIAVLHGKIKASLAATRGVHGSDEILKYVMAGADVVMTASALLRNGIGHLGTMLDDVTEWMERNEYDSIEQMKGSMSHESVSDPTAFERANYIKTLKSYKSEYAS